MLCFRKRKRKMVRKMTEMIAEWWVKWAMALLASGMVTGIGFLWRRQRAIEKGIQALLRDRVLQAYYHYTERGSITLHGLENVNRLYTEYHNLGGNGTITKLVEDMRKLPVVDD